MRWPRCRSQIRTEPSNAKHRVFLFQLLSVMGQWDRALTQLNVAGELDADPADGADLPRSDPVRSAARRDFRRQARAPDLRRTAGLAGLLVEALRLDATDPASAGALREQAFEQAPAIVEAASTAKPSRG
jgi:type VI secretion system protein ImpE